jgi:hypothetical protein
MCLHYTDQQDNVFKEIANVCFGNPAKCVGLVHSVGKINFELTSGPLP